MAPILVVSPHLDDAVLSYGGRLAELASAGSRVIVFTVFAGLPEPPYSPVALCIHKQWDLDGNPVNSRREEDCRAQKLLGTEPIYGHHLDAIYRKDESGRWLIRDDGSADRPERLTTELSDGEEPGLLADITSTISGLIDEHEPDCLVTCAAIGEHVDHLLARDAVVAAAARGNVPLAMWGDFPYIAYYPDIADAGIIPPLPAHVTVSAPAAEPISDIAWETKNRAIRCYRSQLAMLNDDTGTDIFGQLARYCAEQAGRFGAGDRFEITWTAGERRHALAGPAGNSQKFDAGARLAPL